MRLSDAQTAVLAAIDAELSAMGPCLPGSLVVRIGPCGKASCSCKHDPPRLHGPFRSWTRKQAGKTSTLLLSEAQMADYQEMFDNRRRLAVLVRQLEDLGLALIQDDPRWPDDAKVRR